MITDYYYYYREMILSRNRFRFPREIRAVGAANERVAITKPHIAMRSRSRHLCFITFRNICEASRSRCEKATTVSGTSGFYEAVRRSPGRHRSLNGLFSVRITMNLHRLCGCGYRRYNGYAQRGPANYGNRCLTFTVVTKAKHYADSASRLDTHLSLRSMDTRPRFRSRSRRENVHACDRLPVFRRIMPHDPVTVDRLVQI